jgi:dihydroneopterin aldolase
MPDRRDNCRVDRIQLQGLVFSGRHGVSDAERKRAQRFSVDIEVERNLAKPGRTDLITDTLDYRRVRAVAKAVVEGEPVHLLEALADRIARGVLALPGVSAVSVRIAKRPPSMRPIAAAAVSVRRTRR